MFVAHRTKMLNSRTLFNKGRQRDWGPIVPSRYLKIPDSPFQHKVLRNTKEPNVGTGLWDFILRPLPRVLLIHPPLKSQSTKAVTNAHAH